MASISEVLKTKYPIIQAGMVWCSGWKLASAASNAGVLGVLGAGSLKPDLLREHIEKCKSATSNPFGVNVPMLYDHAEETVDMIIEDQEIPIVITSAGNPMKYTKRLKDAGKTVLHVVGNSKFAIKAEEAGVDAVISEGFEAGGHNGREETTTMCLIPQIVQSVQIPVIAAGGIASGQSMAAAFALGAKGVQIGSRFAVSKESSAHMNYKNKVIESLEGDTMLTLKALTPVRMIKNSFFNKIQTSIDNCASKEDLAALLGRGRSKKGILEGDLEEGELEIGQVSSLIKRLQSVDEIVKEIIEDYNHTLKHLKSL